MDMRGYEVPHVLVTCRNGQPITGIDIVNAIVGPTFAELYDDDVVGICCLGILQLVLLGAKSRRNIPEWLLRLSNDRVVWNKYPWASYVWPTLYFQLRNANVRRWGPLVAVWSKKKGRFLAEMVIPFFEKNVHAARLTPDDNEARISSKAYFNGFIDQVERVPFDLSRQNMYEIPSDIYRQFDEQKTEFQRNKKDVDDIKEEMLKFKEEMNVRPVRQENTIPIIVGQHYGFSDFCQFQSMQNILNREKRQQLPSEYLVTPFTVQPPTTMVPNQRVSKTKNKGKKDNLPPLNLGDVLEGYNEEENNVTFLGF
nr:phospholipase-like protein [Tanacetum cinerariifolium]